MDTSDSEYFESADEEFNDEIEDSKESVLINEKLNSLTLSEEKITSSSSTNRITEVETNDEKIITTTCKDAQTKENITTEIEEDASLSEYDECKQNKTLRKNKSDVREVLDKVTDVSSRPHSNKDHSVKESTEPKDLKNKYSSEDSHVQDSLEENLWEKDGWEIEEEIDEPTVKQETLNEKDPLNISTENMWENPEWEDVDQPQTVQPDAKVESKSNNQSNNGDSWGSWGNWGMTSLLSTATQSVSTITNQVSQGFSTVLETGIGAPSPEELAKINYEEEKRIVEGHNESENIKTNTHDTHVGFVLGNFGSLVSGVSNITKFVENTGTKVISGGLETLENIGKKTMEVLQEGDPGLKKKRAFLKLEQEKPILSQVLREAKEKAEQENKNETNQIVTKKVNYEAMFDDYHGLVHLEALEMLSKQCELKLKTLCDNCSGDALIEIQETIDQIKELCELPDEDEDEQLTLTEIKDKLQLAVKDININISYEKLISCWEETESWLENIKTNICSDEELHHQAIETLAQLTALAVEQFHKAGELLLIKDHHSTADEADSLVQLTTTLTSLIGIVAAKFSEKLNLMLSSKEDSNKETINNLITNVFFEASNSSSYIQDAFQLLIPVLQVGVI